MSSEDIFIRLIEEMVEIKVRQHVAIGKRASGASTPQLARLISETNMTDHHRLQQIRQQLAGVLAGSEIQDFSNGKD